MTGPNLRSLVQKGEALTDWACPPEYDTLSFIGKDIRGALATSLNTGPEGVSPQVFKEILQIEESWVAKVILDSRDYCRHELHTVTAMAVGTKQELLRGGHK